MNRERAWKSKVKENKNQSIEEGINFSKDSQNEKGHVEVEKEDNKQNARSTKNSTLLPTDVQIKQCTENGEKNCLQEQKEEEVVIKKEMEKDKDKDKDTEFAKDKEKKKEKKQKTTEQTPNTNEVVIHESTVDDCSKNVQYKEESVYAESVLNKNTNHLENYKIKNSQNELDKIPSISDIKFSSAVNEINEDGEGNSDIFHLRRELAVPNEKEHVEPRRRRNQQLTTSLLTGKFYFMNNKSSICSSTNKFKKMFDTYYDRTHSSLNENKKQKKRKKSKNLHDEIEGAESDPNKKQPIFENLKDHEDSLNEEENNSSHIIVNFCSKGSSSSVVDSEKKEEVVEEQLNDLFHEQQADVEDYTITQKYRSCYVMSDSLLGEMHTKKFLDNSEKPSVERPFKIELEKNDNGSSINVSSNKKKERRFKKGSIGNSNLLKGKKKEKIIIFLNRKYCVWENGKFNDHFYNTIFKANGADGPEEVEIYIDELTKSRIKKFIYKIFPQFSFYSFILYISFVQWLVYLFLLFVQTDSSLSPSHDTLNTVTNYPMRIFKFSEYHRPFTSLLLHSNFNHICSNTYIQLTVGFLLEYLYGTPMVFFVYMFTGIHGMVLSFPLTYCESTTESSTSTFGLIGMFFSEILIMTNFNVDKIGVSVNLICFYLLLLFLKLTTNTALINVWSHFMGLIGGFLFGILLKYKQLKYFVKHDFFIFSLCIIFFITSTVLAIMLTVFHPKCLM